MNRKIISGISLSFLFLAFASISFLVVLTKRHPYFVSKKLRLGALILSISGASVGCFTTTCYSPAQPNLFTVDQAVSPGDSIVISKAISDSITGKIIGKSRNTFSFAILDSTDGIVLKENIQPTDGSFDEDIEEFKIDFGPTILPGRYNLKFYTEPKDSIQNFNWYNRSFPLTITE